MLSEKMVRGMPLGSSKRYLLSEKMVGGMPACQIPQVVYLFKESDFASTVYMYTGWFAQACTLFNGQGKQC
jgi:hypothetical protein